MESGEGIRSDFRPGMRDGREERGLAGVWVADEADFRDNTQSQQKVAFVAGFARLGKARGLAGSAGKVALPEPATSAFAKAKPLLVLTAIGDGFAAVAW